MEAEIRIVNVGEADELRRYARRRLGAIVRDPRSGIEGVRLSVTRAPGGGREGICCQILVRVSPRLSLSVEKADTSARAAIDAAADRLGWALGVWHGMSGEAPRDFASLTPGLRAPEDSRVLGT